MQIESNLRLSIVETIPDNVTFGDSDELISRTTFDAWYELISNSKQQLLIAAYKTSLRGKHVLRGADIQQLSFQGNEMYDAIVDASMQRGVAIKMIENYPPKDIGDNEDGNALVENDLVERHWLNLQQIYGSGKMHTKFIIADRQHLYLGSANLDWRSLSQKIELGILINDCPCLAEDLARVFNDYWDIAGQRNYSTNCENHPGIERTALYTVDQPLRILDQNTPTKLHFSASPPEVNGPRRTWDLVSVIDAIDGAQTFLYIQVMDYVPMLVYTKPKRYWSVIDEAIRKAIIRGVQIRIISSAIHFPELCLRFLNSLQMLDGLEGVGNIAVKILKVPTSSHMLHTVGRERRMHSKFVITDDTAIIGTSNWSGDYFEGGTTGVALVIDQGEAPIKDRHLINQLRKIFLRQWNSEHSHNVDKYVEQCLLNRTGTFCEIDKDQSSLSSSSDCIHN